MNEFGRNQPLGQPLAFGSRGTHAVGHDPPCRQLRALDGADRFVVEQTKSVARVSILERAVCGSQDLADGNDGVLRWLLAGGSSDDR